jgi:Holliday junction resolvase RusA-like endonuclease
VIAFTVHGIPAPQGGSRAVQTAAGARLITTGGVGLKDWRASCAAAAEAQALEHGCITTGLMVRVVFRFPMPKSRPKRMRAAGVWPKTTAPDTDKLQRALGDSLTAGGLIRDDALICRWDARKVEVWDGWTGAEIDLIPLEAA